MSSRIHEPDILEILKRVSRVAGTATGKETAGALGVAPQTFSNWKNEDRGLPWAILFRFAQENSVSFDWLLTGEVPRGRELTDDEIALITAVREAPEIIPSLIRLIYSIIEKREYRPACHTEEQLKVAEPGPRYRTKREDE